MADINLTQQDADRLISLEKRPAEDRMWLFPGAGERISIPLISVDKREKFAIDVTRARIRLTKATYVNRARTAIVLLRLDIDGPPHRNPDGEEIPCPHLHIFREGFGDRWAVPAPRDRYSNTLDLFSVMEAFLSHCNVTVFPRVERGLFS